MMVVSTGTGVGVGGGPGWQAAEGAYHLPIPSRSPLKVNRRCGHDVVPGTIEANNLGPAIFGPPASHCRNWSFDLGAAPSLGALGERPPLKTVVITALTVLIAVKVSGVGGNCGCFIDHPHHTSYRHEQLAGAVSFQDLKTRWLADEKVTKVSSLVL